MSVVVNTLKRGRFISFEGIDGAGKSTQLEAAASWLTQRGIDVLRTREPGGTPLGERLREWVLNDDTMTLDTETLLMFAARREHLLRVIEPALAQGQWVLTDRFTDATYAYQGAGRGLFFSRIAVLEDWTQQGRQPDLTLLLDLTPAQAALRLQHRGKPTDKFEGQNREFYERVRQGYLQRAHADPGRVVIVDAASTEWDVMRHVAAALEERWQAWQR